MLKKISKEKAIVVLFHIILFALLILFFTKICPVIPYDGDDWYFLGAMRQPFPIWNAFNPSKVLPEIIAPIGGYLGAYVIYPITHDYVLALSIAQAIIISSFIIILFYLFYNFIKSRFNKKSLEVLLYELLFAITFFMIFKRTNGTSYYGFWAFNFNCYYHYLIPGIFNACLVLKMLSKENFIEEVNKYSYYKKGLYLVLIYLAVFSSIQLSIILISFITLQLLKSILNNFKKLKIKEFLKNNWLYVVSLLMWFVALIFDANGRRSAQIGETNWFSFDRLYYVLKSFKSLYKNFNILLLIVSLIAVIIMIVITVKNRKKKTEFLQLKNYWFDSIYLIVINVIYLVLLYMKAGSGYANRVDATWGIVFYILLFINVTIVFVNTKILFTKVALPIIIVLFSFVTINLNYRFAQSIFDYTTAKNVDDYIINQIISADLEGKDYVEVLVPKHEDSVSNWPQPWNMAMWLQNTLYSHGIIRNRMRIQFVRSEEAYKELYKKDFKYNGPFYDFEQDKYLK